MKKPRRYFKEKWKIFGQDFGDDNNDDDNIVIFTPREVSGIAAKVVLCLEQLKRAWR